MCAPKKGEKEYVERKEVTVAKFVDHSDSEVGMPV